MVMLMELPMLMSGEKKKKKSSPYFQAIEQVFVEMIL